MQRWMDPTEDNPSGYMYDDGQPEPTYGTQADVDTALAQLQASYPPAAEPSPAAPSVSLNSNLANLSGANYSPETINYLNSLDTQRQALADKYGAGISLNNPEFMYSRQVQEPASDSYSTVYTPESEIQGTMGQDASSIFNPGYDVQSWGGSRDPNNFNMIRLGADQTYTYTDNNTGQTYTASTPQQVQALTQLAKSQSGMGNNSASWSIKDSSGKEVASDTSYTPSFLKQAGQTIADLAVEYGIPMLLTAGIVNPALLAAAGIPAQGALATALGTGLSTGTQMAVAGGGAALGKALKTGDWKQSLISGLTAAATAGALKASGASDYIGSALGGTGAGQASAQEAAQEIIKGTSSVLTPAELAAGQALIASGKFVSNAAVNAGTSAATRAVENVIVSGLNSGVGSGVGSALAPVISSGIASAVTPAVTKGTEAVTVTDTKPTNTGVDETPAVTSPVTPAVTKGTEAVVVTDNKLKPTGVDETPAVTSVVEPAVTKGTEAVTVTDNKLKPTGVDETPAVNLGDDIVDSSYNYDTPNNNAPADPAKDPSTLDLIKKYGPMGLMLAGLIGGGSGKGTGATGTGTYQAPKPLPNIFTAKLPEPSGGLTTGPWAPSTNKPWGANDPGAGGQNLSKEDWYRYGFGPEKSFFKYVPGTPIGMDEPKSKLAVMPAKMAKGGSLAVKGPGDGRSDDINAKLSDGEYVMDAETVAMLGNGSNKAGADALDRFRVNVRKHKGKSLAAGRFSVNAKQPETYLKGRG